jgi:hypothetical protein
MIIANETATTAQQLIDSLQRLVQYSGHNGTLVDMKKNFGYNTVYLSLEEETLTDGSKVYNIIVR